mgnify:CR=1 FL=1
MGMGTVNKLEYRRAVRERLATGRPARISATDGLDELARSVSDNTVSKQTYRQRVAEAAGVKVATTSSGSSTPIARPVSTGTAATAATPEDKANLSWIWWISLFVSVISMFIGLWYVSLFGLVGSIVAVRGAASKGHPVAAGCLVAFSIFAFLISFVVGLFRSFTGGY